jgi:hypothetical protein
MCAFAFGARTAVRMTQNHLKSTGRQRYADLNPTPDDTRA